VDYRVGQMVLIRGGQLDGIVGEVVLVEKNYCHLRISNRLGIVGGDGEGVTTVKNEYLHAMPSSQEIWKTGDLVAIIWPAGVWSEGKVLETAAFRTGPDRVLVEMTAGRAEHTVVGSMEWVDLDLLRRRIEIPAFTSKQEADDWAQDLRSGEWLNRK